MKNKFKRTYGFNVYNEQPEELLEYAYKNDLKNIEINLSKKNLTLEMFTPERIQSLHSLSKSYKISLSFHVPHYINIAEIVKPIKYNDTNYLLKCIHIASELDATHITLHIGKFYWFPVKVWMRKKALNRFVESIKKALLICEDKNIIIALENVVPLPNGSDYYLLGDNIEDFKFIFSNIDSKHLAFCLDTGHANMAEGVLEYLDNFSYKLSCIHYHDNNGFNDSHLPIGKGNISWEDFAEKLVNSAYKGPVISECRNIPAHESAIIFEKYFNNYTTENLN